MQLAVGSYYSPPGSLMQGRSRTAGERGARGLLFRLAVWANPCVASSVQESPCLPRWGE